MVKNIDNNNKNSPSYVPSVETNAKKVLLIQINSYNILHVKYSYLLHYNLLSLLQYYWWEK